MLHLEAIAIIAETAISKVVWNIFQPNTLKHIGLY